MKIHTAYQIGCGGTGSMLVEQLARLLRYHEQGTDDLTLVDGDRFEEKNQARQLFPKELIGANKAKAVAARVDVLRPRVIPQFVDRTFLRKELEVARDRYEIDHEYESEWTLLLVLCVDNMMTRKHVYEVVDDLGFPNLFVVDTGNDLDKGRVSVYARVRGETVTPHPIEVYPNLKEPTDRIPMGCQEVAPSTPQLITANMMSASTALNLVQAILSDQPWYSVVHFDTVGFRSGGNGPKIDLQASAPEKALA